MPDLSDLPIAQLVERQTIIHEVMGSLDQQPTVVDNHDNNVMCWIQEKMYAKQHVWFNPQDTWIWQSGYKFPFTCTY